nr:hypothetical protein [Tanacetum cinerariifolium]
MMLAQLPEAEIQLSKEKLAILADIKERVDSGLGVFTMKTNALFQSDEINLYDSDCDEDVQEMSYSKQILIVDFPDNEIHSDSNIIPYSQYLQESQHAGI